MLRKIVSRGVVGAILLVLACTDQPAAPAPTDRAIPIPGFIVSPAGQTFVSLLPGSLADGQEVVLSDGPETSVRVAVTNGGFDPVKLPAAPGDAIGVRVLANGTVVNSGFLQVLANLPPVVVRTDPPRRRTSVPLNSIMVIVFSEPIDPASVTTGTITLTHAQGAAELRFALIDDGTTLQVQAAAPLEPATDYTLRVGTSVRDLSGLSLENAEVVPFQTAAGDTVPFSVKLLPDTLTLPVGARSGFVVLADSGATVINQNPFEHPLLTWRSSDPSVAAIQGGVVAAAVGRAYVTVEYQGQIDSALVVVTQSPPPGPFRVFPDGVVVPPDFTTQFSISHPEGSEPPAVTWSSTDTTIFVVDQAGAIHTRAPGNGFVVATTGTETDSASVEVYAVEQPPTPRLADQYSVDPGVVVMEVAQVQRLSLRGDPFPPPPVRWTTASPAIATVAPLGPLPAADLAGVAVGTTVVIVEFEDSSRLNVPVQVVAAGTLGTARLEPASPTLAVGDTLTFRVVLDAVAQANFGTTNPWWSLRSTGRTVDLIGAGRVMAVAPGQAELEAHVGSLVARAVITVQ